jgi:hypothetical protein
MTDTAAVARIERPCLTVIGINARAHARETAMMMPSLSPPAMRIDFGWPNQLISFKVLRPPQKTLRDGGARSIASWADFLLS